MAAALAPGRRGTRTAPGDVVVITQKVVSKAEGRLVAIDPTTRSGQGAWSSGSGSDPAPARGSRSSSETGHGFICANAGIDLSNVARGRPQLLPRIRPLGPPDPGRPAPPPRRRGRRDHFRHLRTDLAARRDRRGDRLGRRGGGRRPAGGHRCERPGAGRHRGVRGRRTGRRPPSWLWGRTSASRRRSSGVSTGWLRGSSVRRMVRPPGEDLFADPL